MNEKDSVLEIEENKENQIEEAETEPDNAMPIEEELPESENIVQTDVPIKKLGKRRRPKTKAKRGLKIFLRCVYVFLITLAFIVSLLYGTMWIMVNGPSQEIRRLFVLSVKETSAAGFLADMYLSESEIEAILNTNGADSETDIDTSLIKIEHTTVDKDATNNGDGGGSGDGQGSGVDEKDVEVINVNGPNYMGKMMIVKDPSRVFVGVPDRFGSDASGMTLKKMIEKYGAIGGVNAGGFYDPNGMGSGGVPDGIVIKDGKLMWGQPSTWSTVIGFDSNHILHVGRMSAQTALDRGISEAVSFGPALIVNGVPQNQNWQLGGGINPRTAIGQRADGAVLLLVIDGRSVTSLGVTYDDLIDIMLSYGAVNAGNLDGGSSTLMVYGGEAINTSSYLFGERVLATSFLVK